MQRDVQKPRDIMARPQAAAQAASVQHKKQTMLQAAKKRWLSIVVAVALIVFGLLAYGYFDTKNQLAKLSNPKAASQAESQQLVQTIEKYLELPDETPTLATVSDESKLKEQEFFAKAKNGDRVLIFSKSGRALLYRPSTKKVIEYAKVDLNTQP